VVVRVVQSGCVAGAVIFWLADGRNGCCYSARGREWSFFFLFPWFLFFTCRSHPDWWSAELNGKTGLIPAKYVQVLEAPAPAPVVAAQPTAAAVPGLDLGGATGGEGGGAGGGDLGRGVALYDCNPPRADVLGFKKGEIIILISQSSEDWYVGEVDGRQGLVAKNYIRQLPNELVRQDKSPRTMSVTTAGPTTAPKATPARPTSAAPGSVATPPAQLARQPSSAEKMVAPISPRPASGGGGAALLKNSGTTAAKVAVAPRPVVAPNPVAPAGAQAGPAKVAAPFGAGRPHVAIADYVGARENVLSFAKGDVIMIIDQSRQDWWRGVLRGRTGAVPASYVRAADGAVAPAAAATGAATAVAHGNATPASQLEEDSGDRRGRRSTIVAAPDVAAKMRAAVEQQKKSKYGTALYPFQQQKPGVLVFRKGDVMMILDDSRNDWWKAELNGKVGMVPAKYVEIMKENVAAAAAAPVAAPVGAVAPGHAPTAPVATPVKVAAAGGGAPVAAAAAAPVQKLVAMQYFKSPRPDILGLEPGMEMSLLGKPSPDWWKVELRGKVGLVPAKLVQPLVRPSDAAPTGNTAAHAVDQSATIRTQKAQQMAAAAAVAQGRAAAPAIVMPVVAAASPLVFSPAVGDTVEALIGSAWQRVLVVGSQEDGYVVSASEGSPQMFVQKVRKAYATAAPQTLAPPEETDFRGNLKKSPRVDAAVVPAASVNPSPAAAPKAVPTAVVAPKKVGVSAVKTGDAVAHQQATAAPPPIALSPRKPSIEAMNVAPPSPRKLPPPQQVVPQPIPVVAPVAVAVQPPLVVHQPPSNLTGSVDEFEEARQDAKRRAEGSTTGSLQSPGFMSSQTLDLGVLTGVTMADLDRALAVAGVTSPEEAGDAAEQLQNVNGNVGAFRVGQGVEALFSGNDDWYAATVIEVKKSVASGEFKYVVRYDEYGNEKLLPATSLRSVEAPPEVADIKTPSGMRYEVGAMIEAQYAEDQEWYVAQVNAHTPEGNYFVTFVEYGNYQECAPSSIRDLTVPVEEVLPLLNPNPGGFNLRFKVNDPILARYAEDGLFYSAVVRGITPMGTYWIVFTEYGNEQECAEGDVSPPQDSASSQ
jgi:hypothetical protein